MFLFTAWPMSWLGCTVDPPQIEPDGTGDTGTVEVPLGDDEGSVVVLSWLPSAEDDARTQLLGLFAQSREGIVNLAQCVGSPVDGFCADALPAVAGDSVVVRPFDPLLLELLDTVEVGGEIRLGPWAAPYNRDASTGVGFYFSIEPGALLPTEPVALTLGGTWGPYLGEPVIPVPAPIEVTSPDPARGFDLYDTVPLDLRWVPAEGAGQVFLLVSSPREARLFLLDDDGQEWIDLAPLALADGARVEMTLGRWTVTGIDHQGHDIQVQIQSNQRLYGVWRDAGPRVELTELYDDCAAARSAPGVAPGSYTGDMSGASPDLDPGQGGCTGFQARGPDVLVPIDLQTGDLLTVNFQLVADDASLYLLTDCDDVGTCLVGSDESQTGGAVEQVVHLNTTGGPQRVYAVLDSFLGVTDRFNLDIFVETLGGDVLVPTCIEAMDQGPIGSGIYRGSLAVHADLLSPECTGGAEGGEGIAQIYLEPGQTLRASVASPGGSPKMYLLYHCAIEASCFYADGPDLLYTNATGVAEFFYLVVDGDTNLGDYLLNLTVQ